MNGLLGRLDEILHKIFTYIAESPWYVGPCNCYQLRPLSKKWKGDLDVGRSNLWSLATGDLSLDYWRPSGGSETTISELH